jgi:hypothetical protein
MKILYLTDPQPDYLADQIHDGLCALLGRERVVDFPGKPSYRPVQAEGPGTSGASLPSHGMDDVVAMVKAGQIELTIVSSPRQGSVDAWRTVAGLATLPPTVLLDGEDDRRIRSELYRSLGAGLYFKREFPLESKRPSHRWLLAGAGEGPVLPRGRVHPLPFSVTAAQLEPVPDHRKDVDVSFVGRASHRKRVRAVKLLTQAEDIGFEGGIYTEASDRASKVAASWFGMMAAKLRGDPPARGSIAKMSRGEYRALLARSKTALSIRGGGFDTLRYWEIVAAKTPLISESPDILIPHNFEHGIHAIFCRPDLTDLVEWVRRLREDEGERRRMADAAYAHLLAYHTSARRASYLLDLCRKLL